jgi:hypothetical protein
MCVQMNFAQRSLQPFASLLLQFAVLLWPYIYIILPFLSVSVPFFLLSNIFCKKSFPIALFLKRIFCFSLQCLLSFRFNSSSNTEHVMFKVFGKSFEVSVGVLFISLYTDSSKFYSTNFFFVEKTH